MKPIILVILLLSGIAVCGQTPAEIERQLLVPWGRMHYWGSHFSFVDNTIDRVSWWQCRGHSFGKIQNCLTPVMGVISWGGRRRIRISCV